jgi:type IX secretion system PorP/SprF family membrane protein
MQPLHKKLHLFIFLCISSTINAQEVQLTQFFNSGSNLHPASSMSEQATLSLNYRKQWTAISSGFKNVHMAIDIPTHQWSISASIVQQQATKVGFKNFNAQAQLARTVQLGSTSRLKLGFGLGLLQRSFNSNLFSWDNQYVTDLGFNTNLASGEGSIAQAHTALDLSAGIHYQFKAGKHQLQASLGAHHLNKPAYNLLADQDLLPIRFVATFNYQYDINEHLCIRPVAMLQQQATATNLLPGVIGQYNFNNNKNVQIGVMNRVLDATAVYTAIGFSNTQFGISYDINNSRLQPASNGMGALEFSIVWKLGKAGSKKSNDNETDLDRDGDGIADVNDQCPDEKGVKELNGCPRRNVTSVSTTAIPLPSKMVPRNRADLSQSQIVKMEHIYFDINKSDVKAEYVSVIGRLYDLMKSNDQVAILLSGHTDSDGEEWHNLKLGQSRANEVMQALVMQGISADRIHTASHGEQLPQAQNINTISKALNRRVEITVFYTK